MWTKTGNIVGYVDENGNVYRVAEEKIGTNGESRKIVYDKDGKAVGYVDENGKVVKFSKDDKPKVIGKVGASRRLAYDKDGNVIGYVDKDGTVRDFKGNTIGKGIKTAILSAKTGK